MNLSDQLLIRFQAWDLAQQLANLMVLIFLLVLDLTQVRFWAAACVYTTHAAQDDKNLSDGPTKVVLVYWLLNG